MTIHVIIFDVNEIKSYFVKGFLKVMLSIISYFNRKVLLILNHDLDLFFNKFNEYLCFLML